ncbi:Outer membrane protein TolC [Chitinophaga terrae (ex Kim and Jung 2007)]|uniref:Outer membrane protein TolC n=1 Tax=Chitinophaga terrae (ex Kim and Jung 2007) TaxID=408074 RepID=A0A1H4B7B8_9BACT|nr:TolC family protein [Chitinophaga terrae (ex Kim and Jung 2007)]GEP91207.1 transporter [Chitinophaga terrae (ex Kim and Jung 2007)]SEA44009.1 Outer membrane protein TolC [Chitinophaga terrae (ex Kim and Jung 2007)]
MFIKVNNWLVVVVITMICITHQARSQDPERRSLTLTDVWKQAEVYNKQLQMQYLRVESLEERTKAAKDERLPEVKANGLYARVSNLAIYEDGLFKAPTQFPVVHEYYSVGGDAYLNLYNGGKTSREIKARQTEAELAKEQQKLTASEIRYKAAALYLDVYRGRMYEKVLNQYIRDREKELEEIRQLFKNGVVLKSDVLRAELNLSKQRMSLLEIRNGIKIANQRLNIMIGQPDSVDNQLAMDTLVVDAHADRSYEDFVADAYHNSFEFKISEKETQLSELRLKDVKSNILPKVGLYAEYGYTYPQIQFYPYAISLYGLGQAGVKASMPLSALYQNKHKKAEAKINLERQEIEHADIQDQVREAVRTAYLRYTEALTRIQVANDNITQAKENFRIVNNTYFNQLSLLTDLLDAETQLLQARFDLTTAAVTAQLQYYQLLKATGNL